MNGNLLEYIRWRGDLTFSQSPFNDVDALVFAQIAYNKLEGLMSSDFDSHITLHDLVQKLQKSPDYKERTNLGFMINHQTVDLLLMAAESNRFGNVKVTAFRSIYSETECEQFAAATFTFDKTSVISIRGTDDYLIGWKEDCNISYLRPIPAQKDALLYFTEAASCFKKNNLIITGHSKGGNLSVFAGVMAPEKIQKRITAIYNLDGPGFPQDFFETKQFARMKEKIVSIYPEYDIVGMFFKHDSKYKIIKCNSRSIRQHDPMTWLICGKDFVKGKSFSKESEIFENSFNSWADNMSDDEKRVFIDAIFTILMAGGYKTNLELSENLLAATPKMLESFAKMSRKTKSDVFHVISDLNQAIKEEIPILNIFTLSH